MKLITFVAFVSTDLVCAWFVAPTVAADTAVAYHLTARPWKPLEVPASAYLDRVEGVVRFTLQHQNAAGSVIDPFTKAEHQYGTVYYAHAIGTLLHARRAKNLLDSGVRAMDFATAAFEKNETHGHRVFFITPLVESLELYAPLVPAEKLTTWRNRIKVKVEIEEGDDSNWATYLLKGEWARAKADLIDRAATVETIERVWKSTQHKRIFDTPHHLYHDLTTTPDTLAVEAVGRLNLLALITNGYDGPSASEIADTVDSGTYTALLLQDPSGQMPCNGRTDDHVWGDVGYQLAFELMAQRALARGDRRLAGQYQHAAMLNIANIDRWRRTDIPWAGSYFVTKNHFDPKLRLGYQGASEYSNYNGLLMHHLAQAFLVRRQEIAEEPAPNEIGGYAFALDENFATAFANAGGTFLQIDLKADTALSNGNADYWSTLGVVRIGRPGWDTRLGPSDGGRAGKSGLGTSLCPAFEGNGKQFALASIPDRYHGRFSVEFVHPLLVRCNVDYTPIKPQDGPSFRQSFVLTPDGVLTTLQRTAGTQPFSLVAPLLSNDGQPLEIGAADRIAFSRYTAQGDEQNFIALNRDATLTREAPVRSTFGDLTPVQPGRFNIK